jgi:hypothetical protein
MPISNDTLRTGPGFSLRGWRGLGPAALALSLASLPLRAEPFRPVPQGDGAPLEVLDGPIPGRIRDGLAILTPGAIVMSKGLSPFDASMAGVKNPDAIMLVVGNRISFCPALSCIRGPADGRIDPAFFDHQRTSLLISARTKLDNAAEEQTLAVTTTIGTGRQKAWAARTPFGLGDNVSNGNATYRVVQAGTSGPRNPLPPSRPASAPFTVTDGSVTWLWINDAHIAAKVGSYFETEVVEGAGAAWNAAFNYHLLTPPIPGGFYPNVEFDYGNDSGRDCPLGIDCTNLRVAASGKSITTNLAIVGNETAANGYSTLWGMRLNGDGLASQSAIEVDAASPVGIGFGLSGLGGQSHAIATIQDSSTGPVSYLVSGAHTTASFLDDSSAPVSLSIGGAKSVAGIREGSRSPTGIALQGSYGMAQISGNGWSVDPRGRITTRGGVVESAPATPASSAAPCTVGERAWDAQFEYRCVAANRWKRAALQDF